MSEKSFRPVPDEQIKSLALLYLRAQNLTDVSPEQLYDMYRDVFRRIQEHEDSLRDEFKERHRSENPYTPHLR